MKPMYKGIPFSPATQTIALTSINATQIVLEDVSVLPDGPNYLAFLDTSTEIYEVVKYTSKTDNVLVGVTRAVEGRAQEWPIGTIVRRPITYTDLADMIDNIEELDYRQIRAVRELDFINLDALKAWTDVPSNMLLVGEGTILRVLDDSAPDFKCVWSEDDGAYIAVPVEPLHAEKVKYDSNSNVAQALSNLSKDISDITTADNIISIVPTKAALLAYPTAKVKPNDMIVVDTDETQSGKRSYYKWEKPAETYQWEWQFNGRDYATTQQGSKADTAVQSATIAGQPVSKSGTTLQIPGSLARTVTLTTAGWIGSTAPWTQTVIVNGVTNTNNLYVAASADNMRTYIDSGIAATSQSTNSLIFRAELTRPAIDLSVNIVILP